MELGDENGEEIGGLRPSPLGSPVTVVFDQGADGLARGGELGIAVTRIVSLVSFEGSTDDVGLELVRGDGDLGDSGSRCRGRLGNGSVDGRRVSRGEGVVGLAVSGDDVLVKGNVQKIREADDEEQYHGQHTKDAHRPCAKRGEVHYREVDGAEENEKSNDQALSMASQATVVAGDTIVLRVREGGSKGSVCLRSSNKRGECLGRVVVFVRGGCRPRQVREQVGGDHGGRR